MDIYLRVGVEVSLSVIDNGIGLGETRKGGNGINNLSRRAKALGGEFTIKPGDERGTVATWTVPRKTPARV
jgi:signal transduction histidine kinase